MLPSKIGKKVKMFTLFTSFQHYSECPTSAIRQEDE